MRRMLVWDGATAAAITRTCCYGKLLGEGEWSINKNCPLLRAKWN